MTTSDDEPGFARQGDALAETTHADPLATDGDATGLSVEAEKPARWPLGIAAGLGALLLGFVAWGVVYAVFSNYVGVSVVTGLLIGWAIRVASRRSTIAVRVVAVLLTAVSCVYGPIVGAASYSAVEFGDGFFDAFGRAFPNAFTLLTEQGWQVLVIFAAALALAWMSASPPQPKQAKQLKFKRGATMSQGVPPAGDEPPPSPVMPAE